MNPSHPFHPFKHPQHRRPASGRSLIELLIAMLIALITMAAVMYAISGMSVTGDQQNVYTQFNEEAAIASSLLKAHFRNAGYSPQRYYGMLTGDKNYAGPPLRGCENGFTNPSVGPNYAALTCAAGAGAGADAVAVMYEATTDNADFAGATANDCLGQAITAPNFTPSDTQILPPYPLVENRYFLRNNALMCAGSGNFQNPHELIPNVLDMQITYGIAAISPTTDMQGNQVALSTPIAYLRADQVDAQPGLTRASNLPATLPWARVVSARICLLLASDPNALNVGAHGPQYTDCNGNQVTPTDRRLYRAVTVIVAFRNKAPPCADSSARVGVANPTDRCPPVSR